MPEDAKKWTSSSRASARERAAIAELVKAARQRGDDITGPDGLLKSITATVLEAPRPTRQPLSWPMPGGRQPAAWGCAVAQVIGAS